MEKIIILVLLVMLSGCTWFTKPVEPVCGDTVIYKSYDITMPERPLLTIDNLGPETTNGEAARAYEEDLLNVIEYTIKLENILDPIVTDQSKINITEVPAR